MSARSTAPARLILALSVILAGTASAAAQMIPSVSSVIPSATVQLRDPRSISVAPDGTLFIADTGHHRILATDSAGGLIVETGGFGTEHGQFQWPRKIVANRGATVWVLDYGNRRIEKFSRSLEWQGSFFIPGDNGDQPSQIEEMAVSPQGDIYVFDRDDGRLMRYDPLFRVQAELGRDRGQEFVSALTRMTFVPRLGLAWWERGGTQIRLGDPLLTQVRTLNMGGEGPRATIVMAASDSCLVFGTAALLRFWCDPDAPADSLFSLASLAGIALKRLEDIAFADARTLYVLDGPVGAVYRVSLSER